MNTPKAAKMPGNRMAQHRTPHFHFRLTPPFMLLNVRQNVKDKSGIKFKLSLNSVIAARGKLNLAELGALFVDKN